MERGRENTTSSSFRGRPPADSLAGASSSGAALEELEPTCATGGEAGGTGLGLEDSTRNPTSRRSAMSSSGGHAQGAAAEGGGSRQLAAIVRGGAAAQRRTG